MGTDLHLILQDLTGRYIICIWMGGTGLGRLGTGLVTGAWHHLWDLHQGPGSHLADLGRDLGILSLLGHRRRRRAGRPAGRALISLIPLRFHAARFRIVSITPYHSHTPFVPSYPRPSACFAPPRPPAWCPPPLHRLTARPSSDLSCPPPVTSTFIRRRRAFTNSIHSPSAFRPPFASAVATPPPPQPVAQPAPFVAARRSTTSP